MDSGSGIFHPFWWLTGGGLCSGGRHGASSRRLLSGHPVAPWYPLASCRAARASSPGRHKTTLEHFCTCQIVHTVLNTINFAGNFRVSSPYIFSFPRFSPYLFKFPQTAQLKRKPCSKLQSSCVYKVPWSNFPLHTQISVEDRLFAFWKLPFARRRAPQG